MKVCTLVFVSFAVCLLPRVADAHFTLMAPPSWTTEVSGKGPSPCGQTTGVTNVITPVQGGHPLMIRVRETIPHPGHYRIALAVNSRTELPKEPAVMNSAGMVTTTGTSATAVIQNPPVFPVLEDNVFPHTNAPANMMYQKEIMIPNLTCEKCTLQIIEFMAEHAPDYFYRHCADLKITMDPALPPFQPGGGDGGVPDGGGADTKPADATGAGGAGGSGGGGMTGTGGTPGSGGAGGSPAGTGGSVGSGGTTGGTGGSTGTGGSKPPASSGGSGGCAVATSTPTSVFALLGLLGLALVARRRRS